MGLAPIFDQLYREQHFLKGEKTLPKLALAKIKERVNGEVDHLLAHATGDPKELKAFQAAEKNVIDGFHELWYPRQLCWWMGIDMQKCPLDLFMYQEILYEQKPDLVIECGTWHGGSALYLAHLMDILHHGMVVTVDINRWIGLPQHPRILYLTGNSVDKATFKSVSEIANSFRKVMVILDSDHAKDHVLKELELYSALVTQHQYLIVEDTNVHGHPVRPDHPAGPWEAVEKWLPSNEDFRRDRECERFLLTFNPGGYLKRK